MLRRRFLAVFLMAISIAGQAEGVAPAAVPVVKVGLLFSRSGTMAISEAPLIEATLSAIQEVNSRGRIKLEPYVQDGASIPAVFAQQAERLMDQQGVHILFGCWTSDSRKAVLKVVEARHGLLFYPVQYEGLENSPCCIYTGLTANQQLFPALDWLVKNRGPRLYLVGSDYSYPRIANGLARKYLPGLHGQVVGESYARLGSTAFDAIARQIKASGATSVLSTINGDSQVSFFEAYRRAGLKPAQCPVMSLSMAEAEIAQMKPFPEGHFATWSYFSSLENAANRRLQQLLKNETPPVVLDDPVATAHWEVHALAQAIARAHSSQPGRVREALRGLILDTSMGLVRIDPRNLHTWRVARVGQVNGQGKFSVVWASELPIRPEPFPRFR